MQGKEHPLHRDLELLLKSVNTPGTEIAPWSDVVREYVQNGRVSHDYVSFAAYGTGARGAVASASIYRNHHLADLVAIDGVVAGNGGTYLDP